MQTTKVQMQSNKGMDLSERIRHAINRSRKTQALIAREANITQSAIAQVVSGNVRSLRADTAVAIADATGVALRWLVTGAGPMMETDPTQTEGVPVISWTEAAEWATALPDTIIPERRIPCPVPHSPFAFALVVRGSSMQNPGGSPSFTENDLIYCDPEVQPSHRSIVIAQAEGMQDTILRQLLIEGTNRFLQALNPGWPGRIEPLGAGARVCSVVIAKLETLT